MHISYHSLFTGLLIWLLVASCNDVNLERQSDCSPSQIADGTCDNTGKNISETTDYASELDEPSFNPNSDLPTDEEDSPANTPIPTYCQVFRSYNIAASMAPYMDRLCSAKEFTTEMKNALGTPYLGNSQVADIPISFEAENLGTLSRFGMLGVGLIEASTISLNDVMPKALIRPITVPVGPASATLSNSVSTTINPRGGDHIGGFFFTETTQIFTIKLQAKIERNIYESSQLNGVYMITDHFVSGDNGGVTALNSLFFIMPAKDDRSILAVVGGRTMNNLSMHSSLEKSIKRGFQYAVDFVYQEVAALK